MAQAVRDILNANRRGRFFHGTVYVPKKTFISGENTSGHYATWLCGMSLIALRDIWR